MAKPRNIVCGVDIHKKFLVATILSRDGTKPQNQFDTGIEDLLNFRDWIIENNCECVAVESTGIYWHPVHDILENQVELILANAHQIRSSIHPAGRQIP